MEDGRECLLSLISSKSFALFIVAILALLVIQILYVTHQSGQPLQRVTPKPVSTLIVLGSGGHTAEMLNLLSVLQKNRFTPRFYIAAATDNMSLQKARVFENSLNNETGVENVQFMQIYRS